MGGSETGYTFLSKKNEGGEISSWRFSNTIVTRCSTRGRGRHGDDRQHESRPDKEERRD